MIPKIIHQMWRGTDLPPQFAEWSRTWRQRNPDWEWRLWTDEDLDRLVAERFPDFLPVYRAYPHNVQRADAARYLLLSEFGGVYADFDTDCVGSLAVLTGEDRIVLCEEPREHWNDHLGPRGLPSLLFNGTMASPKGHPFWQFVRSNLVHNRHAWSVLDSTGPMLLTGCVLRYDPAAFALHSCHLFTPAATGGADSTAAEWGALAPHRISRHHWAGTWWREASNRSGAVDAFRRAKRRLSAWRHRLRVGVTRGPVLDPARRLAAVDRRVLHTPLPEPDAASARLKVLVPVRDAEAHLPRCVELIRRLELPMANVELVFCEGDSVDGSHAWLRSFAQSATDFRAVRVLKHDVGTKVQRSVRWHPSVQRQRRAGIARARNVLIRHGVEPSDDWVLWIDADVCDYPPDVVHRLMAQRAKIVVPNCVLTDDGPSFDLNSFSALDVEGRAEYVRYIRDGLYQPPAVVPTRWHLHDLRYLDRVPLVGVGGTMILVHASVHRAGIDFPELPYRDHIETEAFGMLARDAGLTPIGLPNLLIKHAQ